MISDPDSPTNQSATKLDRRRAQNRVAQKAFRQKQATYIQHLERSLEIATAQLEPDSRAPGTPCSATVIIALKTENLELREALLRLRKDFLNLGNAATSHARKLE
jgi:hypothetical protein